MVWHILSINHIRPMDIELKLIPVHANRSEEILFRVFAPGQNRSSFVYVLSVINFHFTKNSIIWE